MARYISLYSGSSGNCSVVEENGKFILIDMGKSARLTNKALTELGLDIKNLQGILVSHEHTDHTAGLKVFLKNLRVPVYTGWATADYLTARDMIPAHIEVNDIDFSGFNIGDFYVKGFETPHDSVGCMGFRIATEKGRKMSIATDLGFVTEDIFNSLRNVDLSVVESNYDVQMNLGRNLLGAHFCKLFHRKRSALKADWHIKTAVICNALKHRLGRGFFYFFISCT